jgi:uncharacterized membrane protein HdeD (DUF308 family)
MSVSESMLDDLPSPNAGWWLPVVAGLISVLFGFGVLSFNYATLWAVTIAAGIGFLLTGAADVAAGLNAKGSTRILGLVLGVLAIGAGIIAFVWPEATFVVLARLVAWLLLLRGVFGIVGAFEARARANELWWIPLVLSVLEVVVAVWAVRYPGRSVVLLVLWIGISAITRGLALITVGFSFRSLAKAEAAA